MAFPLLAVAGLGLQVAGARKNRRAARRAEKAAKAAAEYEAKQLEGKAKDELAIGSYRVAEQAKEGRRVASRAKVLAATSGAGGYEDTISDIDAESEYREMTALFNSRQSAHDLRVAAKAARRHGADAGRAIREQGRADRINSYAGIIDTGLSLYERFGKGYNTNSGDG